MTEALSKSFGEISVNYDIQNHESKMKLAQALMTLVMEVIRMLQISSSHTIERDKVNRFFD